MKNSFLMRTILSVFLFLALNSLASTDFVNNSLTKEEADWLKEHKVIRVGNDIAWAPFEFIDSDGSYKGIASDYMKILEEKLGIKFVVVKDMLWKDVVAAIEKRELDMYSCAVKSPKKAEFISFTKPYLSFPAVFVGNEKEKHVSDIKMLAGKKIGVIKGIMTLEHLEKNYGYLELVKFDTVEGGLNALANNQIDFFVDNLATLFYEMQHQGYTNLKIVGEIPFRFELSMGGRNDWTMLTPILQKALDSITKDERQAIFSKWIKINYEQKTNYQLLIYVALGFVTVILFVLAWNYSLKKRVKEEIEKRQKQEQMLIQQSKNAAMGQMIGIIAHQWKQPVNVISVVAQDIEDAFDYGELDKARLSESIKQILNQIEYMGNTINDFRDFLQPSKQKELFVACEAAIQILHLLEAQVKKHNINIKIHEHEHFSVCGYPNEFKQAVMNIIVNAKDAIVERGIKNGEIEFLFEHDEAKGVIKIRDNAGGIPKELLPNKLFESYITTKGDKGTGLGLNICKVIIEEKMGGKLWVRNVENGAEFVIELPLAN